MPDTRAPTARQAAVLEAIRTHWRDHGRSPTLVELARAVGAKNQNGVVFHVRGLKAKGLVETDTHGRKSRGLWPVGLREAIKALLSGHPGGV